MTDSSNPAQNNPKDSKEDGVNNTVTQTPLHGRITVTVAKQSANADTPSAKRGVAPAKKPDSLLDKRLAIFDQQLARSSTAFNTSFPIESYRDDFVELKQFDVAKGLDRRGIEAMEVLYTGFEHLYVVDDLLKDILAELPKQTPYGWEATSRARNHLNLPTVGALPLGVEALDDCKSIMCYALTHFGVASYTSDRAHYIGHVAGYLLISYYFAHLKIQYGVTPMPKSAAPNYAFITPTVADNTRLVSALSLECKKKIYQLAVFVGQISLYSVDKAIEKMLITEVNDFDKKAEQELLANLLRYGG